MNLIIVVGILLIAIGTYLTIVRTHGKNDGSKKEIKNNKGVKYKNLIIIIGVTFIAIGTYLTIAGAQKENDVANSEIKVKLQETKDEIEALRKRSNIDTNEINKIDNEFNAWAKDLIENRESYNIRREKEILENKNTKINVSNKWFYIYNYFFSTLNRMIDAFNSNSEKKILKEIPNLPKNLFSEEADSFYVTLEFKKDLIWIIYLQQFHMSREIEPPIITIKVIDDPKLFQDKDLFRIFPHSLSISIFPAHNSILIDPYAKWKFKNLAEEYDIKDYQISINEILETILRDQILNID